MFADNNQRSAEYYYRRSMIANDHTQQVGPIAGLGLGPRRSSRPPQMFRPPTPPPTIAPSTPLNQAPAPVPNVSGKTWQDFLTREWFDSSVYRNILDMLNTLDVARQNLYNGALGQFISPRMMQPGCLHYAGLYGPTGLGNMAKVRADQYRAFWGWANQFTPAGQATVSTYIYQKIFLGTGRVPEYVKDNAHVQNVLKAAGYKTDRINGNYGITCPFGARNTAETHNERVKAGLGYSSADIVNLVRSLDWEMNRVHLPLPFNLRQWATQYARFALDTSGIGWSERVKQLRDLKKWIVIMREKIRQAVAASGLERKVAEESLRRENEAIIKRRAEEQAAAEAARLRQIEQERIAARKLIAEERQRLTEELQREIAAAKEAALKAAQEEIRQTQIMPIPPVAVQPEVTPKAPVPAPAPVPAVEFQPPTVITPVPTIAPEPVFMPAVAPLPAVAPVTQPAGNLMPLAIAAAAFFFMS